MLSFTARETEETAIPVTGRTTRRPISWSHDASSPPPEPGKLQEAEAREATIARGSRRQHVLPYEHHGPADAGHLQRRQPTATAAAISTTTATTATTTISAVATVAATVIFAAAISAAAVPVAAIPAAIRAAPAISAEIPGVVSAPDVAANAAAGNGARCSPAPIQSLVRLFIVVQLFLIFIPGYLATVSYRSVWRLLQRFYEGAVRASASAAQRKWH